MGYRRLAPKDRYQIAAYLQSGLTLRAIAFQLNVHVSTVSREIKKTTFGYDPDLSQKITDLRRIWKHQKQRIISGNLRTVVESKLKEDWSPEQISSRLKFEGRKSCSQQTIYRFIKRDHLELKKHLRILQKQGKDRTKKAWRPHPEPLGERMLIEQRPKVVDERSRLGDFERDTVLGKLNGSLLLTIVDRKSRLTKLALVEKKSSYLIHNKTVELLKNEIVHSITNDNSTEFAQHHLTAMQLNTEIYFSRAYRSWERGTNENTNGLLRQYFPKKTEIGTPTATELKAIELKLNSRPRKCFGWRTPLEVYNSA